MEKTKKEKIQTILTQLFSRADGAEFYLVKSLKQFSNSILIKSKKLDDKKISEANLLLKNELGDPTLELLNWIDTVGGLIPKKNIYKIPFFSTEEIREKLKKYLKKLGVK